MKLKLYQIDAFAKKIFEGNPAAVCPLDSWISEELMQKIAYENNLAETVFFVKEKEYYHIRWFTPVSEVDLCGHATIASAYVLFEILNYKNDTIIFSSKSGLLKVRKYQDSYCMDFPLLQIQKCESLEEKHDIFNIKPLEIYKSMDYIYIFDSEEDIQNIKYDLEKMRKLELRGVIVTSKSSSYDFVNRYFAPELDIQEDPVTGSAFTQLVTYWQKVLKKNKFNIKQISQRGGEASCEIKGNRVFISGSAVKYLEGEIFV